MEELLKIKEQELARLAQIKELLQQKLAEETNRANVLQKELEMLKAQANTVPPQMQAEMAQIRSEVERVAEKIPKLEEKVDQILTNLTQFLTKVRVASKMAKPPASEGQPATTPETKEPVSARPLKPSDLMRPAPESPEGETEKTAPVKATKPSDVVKRSQAAEEIEAPSKQGTPEEGSGEKKGKEAELPGAGITTVPYPSDGSIICPRCNKQNYQEMQDPTNIVAYAPVKKFGRKFYCKSCRCNWRYK